MLSGELLSAMSLLSAVISAVFAAAHTVTGLAALFVEKDLLFGFLLETDSFEAGNLLPEGTWKKFLRCATRHARLALRPRTTRRLCWSLASRCL